MVRVLVVQQIDNLCDEQMMFQLFGSAELSALRGPEAEFAGARSHDDLDVQGTADQGRGERDHHRGGEPATQPARRCRPWRWRVAAGAFRAVPLCSVCCRCPGRDRWEPVAESAPDEAGRHAAQSSPPARCRATRADRRHRSSLRHVRLETGPSRGRRSLSTAR